MSVSAETMRVSERSFSWKLRHAPIIFFLAYLNCTWLIFLYGPWQYPMRSTLKLNIFIFCVHLALLVGYVSASGARSAGSRYRLNCNRLVIISALATIVLLFPTSAARTDHWLPDVVAGVSDPGKAYTESLDLREGATGAVEYARILIGPLLAISFPLLIFYWPRLNRVARTLGVLAAIGTVLLFLAMGTNKAIADTVLLLPTLAFASYAAGILKVSRRTLIALAALIMLAFAGFVAFFTSTMAGRAGSVVAAGYLPATGTTVDDDNILVRYLPAEEKIGVYGISMYSSIGYYAVYLSLEEPFEPMYGIGNSMFLTRQAARITGKQSLLGRPYPNRIEKYGWDAMRLWSSIYPWLASDLSFPGVVVFMFFIGRLLAKAWLDTLSAENPFAIAAFAQLLILMFYLPANNQLLQSGEGFTAALGLIAAWLFTRRLPPGPARNSQLLPKAD